jgi:levansucrase
MRRAAPGQDETGSNGWPHAHVYVLPCGHGVITSNSHPQSTSLQVRWVPVTFSEASIWPPYPFRRKSVLHARFTADASGYGRSMRAKLIPLAAASALLVTAAACSDDADTTEVTSTRPSDAVEDDPGDTTGDIVLGFAGSWTAEHVEGIELTADNSIPMIDAAIADERVAPEHWVWDWWPVRDRDGGVADFDGTNIAIALSAPADVLPGTRHDIATLRYLLSDDGGLSWTDGGDLFPDDGLLGSRQWAGSAMYDDETGMLYSFYTAAGEEDDESTDTTDDTQSTENTETDADRPSAPSGGDVGDDISYRQRLAVATASISVSDGDVRFEDWSDHEVLVTADDTSLYATTQATEGGAGQIDAFRDPWYHYDEASGDEYLLFTATMPQAECDGDGVVGIARASDDELLEWELLPPMLDGHCVNNELERPHVVVEDDRTYLLFTTHSHTFRDDTSGPEGLYGFVADSFLGPYEPLNGTGLVLANPQEAPYQAYSWMTLPNGIVTSFFQFFDIGGDVELSYIGDQSPEFQREHFGGTFAPSLLIDFDDDRTALVEELAPGQLLR